jgi:hypothetical protein
MSQENLTFEIELPGGSTNLEEWRKAQALPVSELRQLTTEEKEVARKLGITEESLARSAKADEFGKERMRRKAQEFGQRVNRILEESGSGRVDAVRADLINGRWLVRVKAREYVVMSFPRELVDDLLDSGAISDLEQVKRLIREQLSAAGEKTDR